MFSPKGGVGKSFLAINVATAMARRTDERVALVDADLQFGDIAVLLGIPPQTTLVDAAAAIQYADPELMRSLVSRHDSGLLVLPAPVEPVPGGAVSPQDVVAVCGGLQAMCKYAVVDSIEVWVGTSNWEPGYFHGSRNVAVTLRNRRLALEARRVFETSWQAPGAAAVRPDEHYPPKEHGETPPPGKRKYGG